MFHHHEDIQEAKRGRDHDAEVARDDGLGMIADKGPPTLGRHTWTPNATWMLGQIFPHSTELRGGVRHRSLKASRGEDLDIEELIRGG
jgi:hypothetical protein